MKQLMDSIVDVALPKIRETVAASISKILGATSLVQNQFLRGVVYYHDATNSIATNLPNFSELSPLQTAGFILAAMVVQVGFIYGCYRALRYFLQADDVPAFSDLPSHTPMTISPAGRALLAGLGGGRGRYERLSDQSEHSSPPVSGKGVEMTNSPAARATNPVTTPSTDGGTFAGNDRPSGQEQVQGNIPYYMQPYYQYDTNNDGNEPVARVSASIRNKYRSTSNGSVAGKSITPKKKSNNNDSDNVSLVSGVKSSHPGSSSRTPSAVDANNGETHVKTRYSQAMAASSTNGTTGPRKPTNKSLSKDVGKVSGDNSSIDTASTGKAGASNANPVVGNFEVPSTITAVNPPNVSSSTPASSKTINPTTPYSVPNGSGSKQTRTPRSFGNNWSAPSSSRHRIVNLTPEALQAAQQFQQQSGGKFSGIFSEGPSPLPQSQGSNSIQIPQQPTVSKSYDGLDRGNIYRWSTTGKGGNPYVQYMNTPSPMVTKDLAITPVSTGSNIGQIPPNSTDLLGSMNTISPLQTQLQTPLYVQPQQSQQYLIDGPGQQQQYEIDPIIYAGLTPEQKHEVHLKLQEWQSQGNQMPLMTPAQYPQQQYYYYLPENGGSYSPACVFASPPGVYPTGLPPGTKPIVPMTDVSTSPSFPDHPLATLQPTMTPGGLSHRTVHFPSTDNLLAHTPASVGDPSVYFNHDSPTGPPQPPNSSSMFYDSEYDSPAAARHDARSGRSSSGGGSSGGSVSRGSSGISSNGDRESYNSGSEYPSSGEHDSRGSGAGRRPSMSKSPPRSRSSNASTSSGGSWNVNDGRHLVENDPNLSPNYHYGGPYGASLNGSTYFHHSEEERTVASRSAPVSRQTIISAFRSDRGLRDETAMNTTANTKLNSSTASNHSDGSRGGGGNSGSNKAKLEKVTNKYTHQIDVFIRSRPNFYAPGYVFPITKLFEQVPPPKPLQSTLKDVNAFVKFLRQHDNYFHLSSNRKAMELIHLTPFLEENVRCYGYYHCVNKYCDTRWESDASYAFEYQVCERCLTRVYPYRQDRLPDDYVPKQLTEPAHDEVLSDPDEPSPLLPGGISDGPSELSIPPALAEEVVDIPAVPTTSSPVITPRSPSPLPSSGNRTSDQHDSSHHHHSHHHHAHNTSNHSVKRSPSESNSLKDSGSVENMEHAITQDTSIIVDAHQKVVEATETLPSISAVDEVQVSTKSLSSSEDQQQERPNYAVHSHDLGDGVGVPIRLTYQDPPIGVRQPIAFSWSRSRDEMDSNDRLQTIIEEPNGFDEERQESPQSSPEASPQRSGINDHRLASDSYDESDGIEVLSRSQHKVPNLSSQSNEFSPNDVMASMDKHNSNLVVNLPTAEMKRMMARDMLLQSSVSDFSAKSLQPLANPSSLDSYLDENNGDPATNNNTPMSENDLSPHSIASWSVQTDNSTGSIKSLSRARSYSNEVSVDGIFPDEKSDPTLPTLTQDPLTISSSGSNDSINHQNNPNSIYAQNPLAAPRRSSIINKTSLPQTVDPDYIDHHSVSVNEYHGSESMHHDTHSTPSSLTMTGSSNVVYADSTSSGSRSATTMVFPAVDDNENFTTDDTY